MRRAFGFLCTACVLVQSADVASAVETPPANKTVAENQPGLVSHFAGPLTMSHQGGFFSLDGKLLWTSDGLWNADSGKMLIRGGLNKDESVYVSRDGGGFTLAQSDGKASLKLFWGQSRLAHDSSIEFPFGSTFAQFKKELLIQPGQARNEVEVWNIIRKERISAVQIRPVWMQAFGDRFDRYPCYASPDGSFLAWSVDANLFLWDLAANTIDRIGTDDVSNPGRGSSWIVFSNDSARLAWICNGFQVFDTRTKTRVTRVIMAKGEDADRRATYFGAFSPDHALFFYSTSRLDDTTRAGQIHKIDLALGTEVAKIPIRDARDILILAHTSDGQCLRSPYGAKVSVFLSPWFPRSHLLAATEKRISLSFDGRLIAMSDEAGAVAIWETATFSKIGTFHAPDKRGEYPFFSPDSRRLATQGANNSVTVWDLTFGAAGSGGPKDLEQSWIDLASSDARTARQALWRLVSNGGESASFLERHLHRASVDRDAVDRLVRALDDSDFAVRDRALGELERIGPAVRPQLLHILSSSPSLEVKTAIGRLFNFFDKAIPDAEVIRSIRAIESLERINGNAPEQIVARLAKGAKGALETEAASATLDRLRDRRP